MKPRLIVDTDVLISAIFFETGNEARILDEVVKGKVALVSSLDTLQELRETLAAPKFKLTLLEVLNVFQLIVSVSEIVLAPPTLGPSRSSTCLRRPKVYDPGFPAAEYLQTGRNG